MSGHKRSAKWIVIGLVCVCIFAFHPSWALAQTCNKCDHTIDVATTYVDASKLAMPVKPGDTVCFKAGKKPFMALANFKGSAKKYITFLNCGGQVLIQNSPRGFGFAISASQYFKILGNGTKGVKYGFKLDGTRKGASGLTIGSKSSDFEVGHFEIMRTGFAGITAKTDPNCSRRDMRSFVMRNVHFYNNYIHDTGGEGFYIGYFAYPTRTVKCDNKDTTLYPHKIEGVSIHHNVLDKNGWDAIQLGSAPKDASIHHNVVTNYATAKERFQQSGIQLNAGAAADVYNNILLKGTGQGIAVFGYGGNKVYNNLIVGAGADGIYVNDKTAQTTKPYAIINNTIVTPARYGIGLSVQKLKNNLIYNNLVVAPGDFPKSGDKSYIAFISSASNYKLAGNLKVKSVALAVFSSPGRDNYRLQAASPAVDKGVDVSAQGIAKDLDDNARSIGKTDVGAYEYQPASACKDGETRSCPNRGTQTCKQGKWQACVPGATQEPTTEAKPEMPQAEPTTSPEQVTPDASAVDTAVPDTATDNAATPDNDATDNTAAPDSGKPQDTTANAKDDATPETNAPQEKTSGNGPPNQGCGCQADPSSAPIAFFAVLLLFVLFRRRPV